MDVRALDDHVQDAAGDFSHETPEDVAQAAYEAHQGDDAASSSYADSPDAALYLALARSARGHGPSPEQATIAAEVEAHEADGGVIEAAYGEVSWRADGTEHSPLYRACADPEGAPARFNEDGEPVVWTRGSQVVRHIFSDGVDLRHDPTTGNPVSAHRPNGSFDFYDPQVQWNHHRPESEGPARFDEDGARWYVDGELHRDPDEGPAAIYWDGRVSYQQHGLEIHPTVEQTNRQGVEPYRDPSRPTEVDYRVYGSEPDEPFDLTGHRLDHGLRIKGA